MKVLQFGLALEERVYPMPEVEQIPYEGFVGPLGLLHYLEKHLGIRYPERHDYLRYEQYRQLLMAYLALHPDAFYARSFEADKMATAVALLGRRDELLLGGWNFHLEEGLPKRLYTLAAIEQLAKTGQPTELFDSTAERFCYVLNRLSQRSIPLETIYLNEPLNFLPPHLQQLFGVLKQIGVTVVPLPQIQPEGKGDLANFQRALLKEPYQRGEVQGDGSLVIIRAKRETDAAIYWAKLFRKNPSYRPVCLIPAKNRALDNALIEEGLPSLGIRSASLARPTLQLLKLASVFLWKPIDPYKILEFVSLPNAPIHPVLAREIAKMMAKKPGLFSGSWNAMVRNFFDYYDIAIQEQPERAEELREEQKEAQEAYRFWFNRRRYESSAQVPKFEVIDLYRHVSIWAKKEEEELKKQVDKLQKQLDAPQTPQEQLPKLEQYKGDLMNRQPALEALRIQSSNIVQILEALPEDDTHLSNLRLERLVRTINEPAAMQFRPAELGHLSYVHESSGLVRPTKELLWWNFVAVEREPGFARWYQHERSYLQQKGMQLETPSDENARLLWQRLRPVLQTKQRLILVIPEYIDGQEQLAHPLWGDLCAALGEQHLERITIDLDLASNPSLLELNALPEQVPISATALGKPKPYLFVDASKNLQQTNTESFSSLDNLLYYPYQWVFRHQMKLNKSSMLSVVNDRILKGNMAHRIFEDLMQAVQGAVEPWKQTAVFDWIDEHIETLLEREGAVLLMYGYEPERIGLINTIKRAAWALIKAIQENGWRIKATEAVIHGKMADQELKGVVDLVLERTRAGQLEHAIVDLKWGGSTYRKSQIQNNEDLQLVIYSKLLAPEVGWAHTAYFIMESGKLIARNNQAFDVAEVVQPDQDFRAIHESIWQKMIKTYEWRMEQIRSGKIEVRTEETAEAIDEEEDEMDMETLLELLAMKKGNAPFDDYQVLINLIN